jgi:transcriptional regulator with XRE-family HTH domain
MMTLREIRTRKLLTAGALAKKSGVSTAAIFKLERGEHAPSLATIGKLAGALEVKPEDVEEFKAAIDKAAGRGS